MRLIGIILLFFFICINSNANEQLIIFNQNSSEYPQIKFNFYNSIDNSNSPLNKDDLEIYENSTKINDFNISKINDTISEKNLFVFALDLSGSLNIQKIQFYKKFINVFISKLDFTKNRVAIIGFNNFAFNLLAPDTSIANLDNVFLNLKYFGNSNYDSLFLGDFNALSYQKYPEEKRQIIILNDGSGQLNFEKVKDKLTQIKSNVYSVSFNSQNLQELKKIITEFDGLFVDNISNLDKVEYYTDLIRLNSLGYRPQEIIYNSSSCSINNEIDVINKINSTKDKISLSIEEDKFPFLEFIESNSIDFGLVHNTSSKQIKINVKPINQDIVIKKIIDDPIFKISGITQNQILKKNNIYEIVVRYLPLDTNYIFKKLELLHTACFSSEILVSGGVPNKENLPKNLKIIQPNGNERININENYLIKWEGILPQDTVSIEFSSDNGIKWDLLSAKAIGLNFDWINLPNINTNQGLIRLKNYSKKDEFQKIKSLKGINGTIVGLKWSDQTNRLYTGSKDGFIRLWDTDKAEPIKTIINGINNLNFFDISNDEKIALVVDDNRSFLKFYDIQSSFLIDEFTISSNLIFLDWDDLSYNFVVGAEDGKILIYEYPNQKPFLELNINNDVSVVKFSPLGNKIAIGTAEGNIFVYNLSGQLVNQFKNSDVAITDISWNKSNTIISVSTSIEVIKIWDTETGINVLQINEKSKPVIKTGWSPNLKYITTINSDKIINFWKPEDGSLFYSFNLHSQQVSDLVWNKDGVTVASGADEGEVLIWSINDIPFEKLLIQEDQSDAVFSLVKPSIEKIDIFLGQHSIGTSFDTTVTNFLVNNGEIDITIDSIKIWGDTKDNFQVLSQFPFTVNIGNSLDLKLNFTPKKEMSYVDSIVIFSGNVNYKSLLNAIGIKKRINIEPLSHNFGDVKFGNKSANKQIKFENLSSEVIEIDDFLFDTKNGFNTNNFNNTPLEPFETRIIDFYFEPNNIGEVSAINYLKFSDINDIYFLVMNGKGIAPIINIPVNIELPSILCDNSSSSSSFFIRNFGNDTLLIDSIYIQQENDEFQLDLSKFIKKIIPNDSSALTINFTKSFQGFSSSDLIIKTNKNANGKNEFNVSLIGQKEKIILELRDKEINLFAEINESKVSLTRIYNKSSIPIFIEPNFSNQYFKIISKLPLVIVPNDSADIDIELNPISENGLFSSILTIKDTCGKTYNVDFNAYIGLKNAKISIIDKLNFDTLICRNVSNPKSVIIKNIGEVPLIIGDVIFSNNGQDNFSISKNLTKSILEKNESDSILVYVDAVEIGKVISDLRVFSNAENSTNGYNSVSLEAYIAASSAKPELDTLLFDDLYENKNYQQTLKIANDGNSPLFWEFPIEQNKFIIDSIIPAITLANQESIAYVTFIGGLSPTIYIEELYFNNTCDKDQKIVLVANVNKKAALGIRAGTINSSPGDTVELPIYLYLKESNLFPIVDYYESELKFNGTLLIPIDFPSTLDDELNRTVNIKLNPLPDESGIIGKIRFVSYLGNSDSSIIFISNTKAIGDNALVIEENNGIFYLDSVCYAGGPRLIGSTGVLRLFPNYPNPVINETKIPFSIIEKGIYQLEIYDLLSNLTQEINFGNLVPGTYEVTLNLTKYSVGNYFYLLRTPSKTLIRKMTINR